MPISSCMGHTAWIISWGGGGSGCEVYCGGEIFLKSLLPGYREYRRERAAAHVSERSLLVWTGGLEEVEGKGGKGGKGGRTGGKKGKKITPDFVTKYPGAYVECPANHENFFDYFFPLAVKELTSFWSAPCTRGLHGSAPRVVHICCRKGANRPATDEAPSPTAPPPNAALSSAALASAASRKSHFANPLPATDAAPPPPPSPRPTSVAVAIAAAATQQPLAVAANAKLALDCRKGSSNCH